MKEKEAEERGLRKEKEKGQKEDGHTVKKEREKVKERELGEKDNGKGETEK